MKKIIEKLTLDLKETKQQESRAQSALFNAKKEFDRCQELRRIIERFLDQTKDINIYLERRE